MAKLTFADRAFLGRVERGEIKKLAGYTKRRGGYTKFYGGEKTFYRLWKLGLVIIGVPSLGKPAIAKLTDAGRAALTQETPHD